uniref:Uncharacterized protein n=1 Tax=Brassica oleracea var. oleracea TaxID=109376 RepID=A0A0D2ZPC2_BRAOL
MPTRDQRMLLLGLRWHLMRNQSPDIVRIDRSMVGGAWPFLVGGAWPSLRLNLTQHGETYQVCDALRCSGPHVRYTDVFNEFTPWLTGLVSASHQLALTTSLPFVHTARRSYRLNDPVKCWDRGDVNLRKDHCRTLETERPENDETSLPARLQVWLDHTHSFWISSNPGTKSVKENATKQPAFANPERVFVRKLCYNNPVNHQVFERKLRPKPSSQGHVCLGVTNCRPPPSSQGYGTEADLLCATARGWPKPELRMPGTA